MTVDPSSPVVHRTGSGPGTWAMGSLFEHLVSARQTDGRLGMSVVTQPPGTATPLHRHTREAEALFVLEGEITYGRATRFTSSPTARSSTSRRTSRTPSGSGAARPRGSSR